VSLWGINASLISLCGYKVCRAGYLGSVEIPRHSIIVPVTAPDGRIVSIHNGEGHWFTPPQVHCTNLIRAQWSNQIDVFNNTIEADTFALTYNVAAIALNGFALEQLSQRLVGKSPRIVTKQEAAAAWVLTLTLFAPGCFCDSGSPLDWARFSTLGQSLKSATFATTLWPNFSAARALRRPGA
jgi:hypothetical protein